MRKVDWQRQPQHRKPVVATAALSTLSAGELPSSTRPGRRGRVQGKERAPQGPRCDAAPQNTNGFSAPNRCTRTTPEASPGACWVTVSSRGCRATLAPFSTFSCMNPPTSADLPNLSIASSWSRPHSAGSLHSLTPGQNLLRTLLETFKLTPDLGPELHLK